MYFCKILYRFYFQQSDMYKINIVKLITFLLLALTISVSAQHDSHQESAPAVETHSIEGIKAEIKAGIEHHLADSHDFTLYHSEKNHISLSIPLPIILWDEGFHFFMSSKFHFGENVVESNGKYYKLYHSKIYNTDAAGTINYDKEHGHYPTNAKPLDFSITKSVVSIIFIGLLMFFIFSRMAKSYAANKGIPTGAGRIFEPLVLYVRDEIAIPNIGEKHYKKYMNYLLTVFFFVWFLNLLGLSPLGINVTGNIAITFSLAILTYLITTFTAKKDYWKHIFWMPGVPKPMRLVLAPIELLGTVIKPFSLMIRLYANILAGHIVLMSIIGLMFVFKSWIGSPLSFGLSFALFLLELLVAALQAYIFTMLSALYFGAAAEEHHDDH